MLTLYAAILSGMSAMFLAICSNLCMQMKSYICSQTSIVMLDGCGVTNRAKQQSFAQAQEAQSPLFLRLFVLVSFESLVLPERSFLLGLLLRVWPLPAETASRWDLQAFHDKAGREDATHATLTRKARVGIPTRQQRGFPSSDQQRSLPRPWASAKCHCGKAASVLHPRISSEHLPCSKPFTALFSQVDLNLLQTNSRCWRYSHDLHAQAFWGQQPGAQVMCRDEKILVHSREAATTSCPMAAMRYDREP